MFQKDLVDLIYEIVLNHLQKKVKKNTIPSITFNEICKGLKKKIPELSENEFNNILGSLYTDLLQDNRFIFLRNNKWTLRELNNLEFLKKNQNLIYDYDSSIKVEEVYDEDALPDEMINSDNETYDENENEISRDSFDSISDSNSNSNDPYDDPMKYEYDDEI